MRMIIASLVLLAVASSASAQGTCTPACANGGSCDASNNCVCYHGWGGADCTQPATCSTPCKAHAYCTSTDTCTCLHGWSGANCDVEDIWMLPSANAISQYSLSPNNLDNYVQYLIGGISNPQSDGSLQILANSGGHTGKTVSKLPISGLTNFNINVTVEIGNEGNLGSDGFFLHLVTNSSIDRTSTSINNKHIGTYLVVSPYFAGICLFHTKVLTDFLLTCDYGYIWKASFDRHILRQKMHIGIQIKDSKVVSLYWCRIEGCSYLATEAELGPKNIDISTTPAPMFLSFGGYNGGAYDYVNFHEITFYKRDVCDPKCVFGTCVDGACVCSAGYTGATCETRRFFFF